MSRGARTASDWGSIRRALLDLSFEEGYANITLPALLERADLDRAAFEAHFACLEDCLCGVLEAIRKDLMARLERATEEEACWRERIRATGFVLWDFLREDPRVTHICLIEARRSGERPRRLLDETLAWLTDRLDEGRAEHAEPESVSRATSDAVGARIFEQICEGFEMNQLAGDDDTIRLLIYEAVRPYLGPDAAAQELNVRAPSSARPGRAAS